MGHPDWALAAVATIDAGKPLHVIALRADGRLAAVAPFVIEGHGLTRRLVPIADRTFEPPIFAFRDSAALGALFDAIGRSGIPLFMRGAYADGAEATAFAEHPTGGLRPRGRAAPATAFKRLDIADLDATISGQRRSVVKRKRKAAEKLGALDIAFLSPGAAEVDAAFDELVVVEAAGWKGKAGTALAQDVPLQDFFRTYARAAAARGEIRFGRVSVGGRLAAVRMDVERAAQRWELKIGYDEGFADVSPGQLLSYETFRDAMERGSTVHNFLGGYEAWQDDWGIEVKPLANLRYYLPSIGGLAALAADSATVAWRRVGEKLKR